MADVVDVPTRSRMMASIRGKNTRPELLVRKYLHSQGLRFRLNVRSLPGSPDLVLPRYHVALFVHGCFWHRHQGCRFAYNPKSNAARWQTKFSENVQRDIATQQQLVALGWRVLVVWECALRASDRQLVLGELADEIVLGGRQEACWPVST
ncbi:MAG: very short patch repair endonuclease [Rhodocyclaceae bacterium]